MSFGIGAEKSFENFQNETDQQIYQIDKTAFVDGVVNIGEYISTSPRILWILKEPNSTEEKLNWRDEIKKLNNGSGNLGGFEKTFSNIVYISYGILNRKKWKDINWIEDEPKIVEVLEKIAFINIKKSPGGRQSKNNELKEYYLKYKSIILDQIRMFRPNVIIGGNTIGFIIEDLKKIYPNLNFEKYIESTNLGISFSNEKSVIVFDARHPQNTSSSREAYCDDIIENYINLTQKHLDYGDKKYNH